MQTTAARLLPPPPCEIPPGKLLHRVLAACPAQQTPVNGLRGSDGVCAMWISAGEDALAWVFRDSLYVDFGGRWTSGLARSGQLGEDGGRLTPEVREVTGFCVLDGAPDPVGRARHVDVAHAHV